MSLVLVLVLILPLLLLPETGHLRLVGSCCLGRRERAACCRRGDSGRRKTGGRWGWLEEGMEEKAGEKTTRATAESWRVVYCFSKFGRVDFDIVSHCGWATVSHLYVIKLSRLCQPSLPSYIQNHIQQLDYFQMILVQESFKFLPRKVQFKKQQPNHRPNSKCRARYTYHPSVMQVGQRKLPTY